MTFFKALLFAALVAFAAADTQLGVPDYTCLVVYGGRLLTDCPDALNTIEAAYPFDSSSAPSGVSVTPTSACCTAVTNLANNDCACSSSLRSELDLLGHPTSATGYAGLVSILAEACSVEDPKCASS